MRLYRRTHTRPDGSVRTWGPWWIQYHLRGRLVRQSLRTRDRRAAEIAASDVLRAAELRAVGVLDPHGEGRARPLAEHLDAFASVLLARDVVPKYRQERMKALREFASLSRAARLGDLDVAKAGAWVGELAQRGLSARSLNSRILALKQFGGWLLRSGRLPFDPFATLSRRNEAADPRRVRRALTPDEVGRLLGAARRRAVEAPGRGRRPARLSEPEVLRRRALGETRALVYLVAVSTGLRAGEIRRLTWGDIDLERGRARVTARSAKSRREQSVELNAAVRAALLAARPPAALPLAPVVPAGSFPNGLTFHADLKAAGIARRDASGRVVDFHALRHTFVSHLAAAGVHPRVAMALARHSDIALTMRHYTDVSLLDLKGAVERIAIPPAARPGQDEARSA